MMIDVFLFPLKILLIGLDLLITIISFGWIKAVKKILEPEPLRSVPVANDPAHRVRPEFKGHLIVTPREGCYTLYDLVNTSFRMYGTRNCMGYREFLGYKVPKKVKHFGQTKWLSFAEVGKMSHQFGAALRGAKIVPAPIHTYLEKVTDRSRIAIFENTCKEWMISAIGAFTQSITVVTVYTTLGMDAVVEAVQDNIVAVLVCNKRMVTEISERRTEMPTLTHIVYTNDAVAPDDIIEIPLSTDNLRIVSFEDFLDSGDVKAYPPNPPEPTTAAVVMYTSGSTGKPKGVVISHSHVVACIASLDVAVHIKRGIDLYIAFLPLAHILEMVCEFMLFAVGCGVCYSDPKSITSSGAFPHGALEEFSPTLITGVPKIWDVIKKGIEAKIASGSPVLQYFMKTAFEWKHFAIQHAFDTPLFNVLVFNKFKAALGGRVRFGLSGGGPLNEDVQDFIRCAFGLVIIQGYGLTETCAAVAAQDPSDVRGRITGIPLASVEVKLISTPEVSDAKGNPYLSTDTIDAEGNPILGRGEVTARGNNISNGYYMMPDETKEVFKQDGWFHTGDIAQFMSDGSLRLIDRIKNLVKLKSGEYVALEKMEMTYGNSHFVDSANGGVCCYGDGDMDRCIALLQLSQARVMNWASENNIQGDYESIKNSKALNDAVMADMNTEYARSDLHHIEKLVAVALLSDPWTPKNGCLTAASKLQRRVVITKFEKEFNDVRLKGIF